MLFYDTLVNELRIRSLIKERQAGAEERGNIAFLSEKLPPNEYEQYLKDCVLLDENELCWKVFMSLYEELKKQRRTSEDRELDEVLFVAADMMHSMGKLHDYICIPQELFPEWFYTHEKLDKLRYS